MTGDGFYIGEIIWGKLRGYPAWPGKILENLGNKKYNIIFFGEDSYATLTKENIFHFNAKSTQTKNKKLLQAINEAKEELEFKKEEQAMSDKEIANPNANENQSKDDFKIMLSLNNTESIIDDDKEEEKKETLNNDDRENNTLSAIIQIDDSDLIETLTQSQSTDECPCFLNRKTSRQSPSTNQIEEGIIQHVINYLLCIALQYQKNLRRKINIEEEKCLSKIFDLLCNTIKSKSALETIKNAKTDILIQYILNKLQTEHKELKALGNYACANIQSHIVKQLIHKLKE